MKHILSLLIFSASLTAAYADIVVPTRTIPAHSVISADAVILKDANIPGSVEDASHIIGMEARIALFAGRPIRLSDVRMPAVVERNGIIPLVYQRGPLSISAEGRALNRASPGDVIRVMNLSSRTTVTARIGIDGAAYTSQ